VEIEARLPVPETDSVEDWSPDGQWFITCSDRHPPHGASYQIYLMKVDGTEQCRLTEGRLNVHSRFCPDGRKIVYICQTAKGENSVWVVDVDGKNPRQILKEINLVAPGSAWRDRLATVFAPKNSVSMHSAVSSRATAAVQLDRACVRSGCTR
jgi:WD40-like Beta Propeller Repeat